MRIPLELNVTGDVVLLNFWDYAHGHDVVCTVTGDGLVLHAYDDVGTRHDRNITLAEFVGLVKRAATDETR